MEKQIRILHVVGQLNRGGVETLIMNIYRNIDREKIQFDFVVHGDEIGVFEKEIHMLGGKIYQVPKYQVWNHLQYKDSWRKLLDSLEDTSIIHSHIRSTASIFMKIAQKKNKKTIIHSHSTSNEKTLKGIIKYLLQKNIVTYADYLFACSIEAGKWLYGEESNFTVIPNSIDTTIFSYSEDEARKIRNELNVKDNIVFGHVGRFSHVKNHSFLIEIFKELIELNKNVKLILIGDGELKGEIEEKVNKSHLKNSIILLGTHSNIAYFMQAMDFFILPSKYEGLPTVLIEAQSMGLKSFVSNSVTKEVDLTSLIEYIDLNKSPKEWAETIYSKMNKTNIDRKCKNKIIQKKGYEIKDVSLSLEEFYKNILNN